MKLSQSFGLPPVRLILLIHAGRDEVSPQKGGLWFGILVRRSRFTSRTRNCRKLRADLGVTLETRLSAPSLIAIAVAAIALAACSANSGPKEAGGTAAGAVAGGLIGNAIGAGTGNRLGGTVIGAAIGGLIGNRIGAALDDEDKRRAYAAEMQALEAGPSGAPVAWRNPDSGRYGDVVPGPAYQASGATCRQYTQTVYIDGTPQTERGTACRNLDGTWTSVN
jgi:surface antigen